MNSFAKTILAVILILFFSVQFYLTIYGGFLWPFSSHRLFSQHPTSQKEIVQAVVTDSRGNEIVCHPGKVIPIEYSRCSGLIRKLALAGSKEQKTLFCRYLVERVNHNPWWAFDEMQSALQLDSPAKSIRFETHIIQFTDRGIIKLETKEQLLP